LEMSPKDINKSPLGSLALFDKITERYYHFSIFSKALLQYVKGAEPYRYRIVQKDQKGHREISVLNASFRLGAMFVETIAKTLSNSVGDVDLVNNPEKDLIVEAEIKRAFKDKKENGKKKKFTICFDNSDQKRWGPNHIMNFFAATLYGFLRLDHGLFKMCLSVLDKVLEKRAKYPESLIDLALNKKVEMSNSAPISSFLRSTLQEMKNGKFEETLPYGMCQGILHALSSILHAIMAKTIEDAVSRCFQGVEITSFTTSDDAERICKIPLSYNKFQVLITIHTIINSSGNLFNILRNNAKSSFNFHIAELNSNFYKSGILATPSLKQRIAKIDVGNGTNHIEDYLDALSSAASYLSSGGSYMGAFILSILNLTLHTEQWLRWGSVNSDDFRKPVEFGGFPVVEPISTLLCGGIANLYLRVRKLVSPELYSRLYIESVIAPPEEVSLIEFSRSERSRKTAQIDNVTIYKSAGPLGLFQLTRTDKKLSQFERRHGMSSWPIPNKCVALNRFSSQAGEFLFSVYRSSGMSLGESNLGVNSFYIRFTEPWLSFERKAYRISMSSPFSFLLGTAGERISHKELIERLASVTAAEADSKFIEICRSSPERAENRIISSQLILRLTDTSEVATYLCNQWTTQFIHPRTNPTIKKVALRGHSALNTDTYYLRILKALTGEKSRYLINKEQGSMVAYESLEISVVPNPIPLNEGVIQSDNVIALFNKFIKRQTKMTIPGNATTLSSLVKIIIKLKFTEQMGVLTSGSLDIQGDRPVVDSHSSWIQDLLKVSKQYQANVASSVLGKEHVIIPKVGIISASTRLTDLDTFEITRSTAPSKFRVLKSTNKDHFITDVKLWLPTSTSLLFSKRSLDLFMKGKLSFSHDYYIGSNRFFRFTKNKYFIPTAGGVSGQHCIVVKKDSVIRNGKINPFVSYRHVFLFPIVANRTKIRLEIKDNFKNEAWVRSLATKVERLGSIASSQWYDVSDSHQERVLTRGRTSYNNDKDFVIFHSMLTSTEFEAVTNADSLCVMLKCDKFEFPISYVDQDKIEAVSIGYTLTHADIKIAVRDYFHLRSHTNSFSRSSIKSQGNYKRFLDFVIIGSSVSTPDYIIKRAKTNVPVKCTTGIQLDILKSCLISDKNIGVHVASSRFNQFLLNMGERRNHSFNYIARTITGETADAESEAGYEESSEEDIILTESIPEHQITREELGLESIDERDEDNFVAGTGFSWADEMIGESSLINDDVINTIQVVVQTVTGEDDLFNDSDDAQADIYNDSGESILDVTVTNDLTTYNLASSGVDATDQINQIIESFGIPFEWNDDTAEVIGSEDNPEDEEIKKIQSTDDGIIELGDLSTAFNKLIAKDYNDFGEYQEPTVASVASSFTINPVLENARNIISFIKGWLSTAGSVSSQSSRNMRIENIAQITDAYISITEAIGDVPNNILENMTGQDNIMLPVELSALSVISELY